MSSFTKSGTSNAQSDGGNVFNGATTISNTGSSGRIRFATINGDTYNADATFNSSGQDVQIAYSGDNTFAGNITINSNKVVFNTNTGKVTFTGTNNQTLNGSYNYPFKKLAINKAAGTVTANTTLSVDDSLIFIQGNLITTSTNLLTMKHGSTATGASNSSFVSGPVKKVGNSAFVFDVGTGSTYRPLTITAPSNTTDAFTAEYYSVGQSLGSTKDTTITFVSDCGYWKLDLTAGSSNITPKFAFDSLHCDYLTVKPVHIALWNGTKWTDKGEAVTESTNKTTSSAMTSYGYFALAYNLVPGDAPQYPVQMSLTTSCTTTSDNVFDSDSLWYFFSVDSAVVKFGLYNPKPDTAYASIKSIHLFEKITSGIAPVEVQQLEFDCDSSGFEFISFSANLDTTKDYHLLISKYNESNCLYVSDTIPYYANLCIYNLRTNPNTQICVYNDPQSLLGCLGNGIADYPGSAVANDIVAPSSPNLEIDLDELNDPSQAIFLNPLYVEPGVRFTGDYDALGIAVSISTVPPQSGNFTLPTYSNGTVVKSSIRGPSNQNVLANSGYSFIMREGSSIQNIRFKGAMPGFQDFNQDTRLCAGIRMVPNKGAVKGPFVFKNCEVFDFSYAGIFVAATADDVTIENCMIHNVKGSGGSTTAKGYGIWNQGSSKSTQGQVVYSDIMINKCILNACKHGIDAQPNLLNLTILNCTFGDNFYQETINRHADEDIYNHPPVTGGACLFYSKANGSCSSSDITNNYDIAGNAAGDVKINNSVFYGLGNLISFPYPVTLFGSNAALYSVDVSNNTFVTLKDEAETFQNTTSCNIGGYARISDNYIESCTWDYEKSVGVNGQPSSSTNPPIINSTPNSFLYKPDVAVGTGSPQPPQFKLEVVNPAGIVQGFTSTDQIPYINEGDNVTVSTSKIGTLGSQTLAYIIHPNPNNGGVIDNNHSAINNYYDSRIITSPSTNPVSTVFGPAQSNEWNTNNPGLYGIGAVAIDGAQNSSFLASQQAYAPLIIKPNSEYIFCFNLKDSYFANLYGKPNVPTGVYKQVAINGQVIWQEDISEGGDDWEYLQVKLDSADIIPFLDASTYKNTITFSIAIPDPSNVKTYGVWQNNPSLRGLMVWVDDVYLKKFGSAQNLIKDGSMEYSSSGSLPEKPTENCDWYAVNIGTFGTPPTSLCTSLTGGQAKNTAQFTSDDMKSGNRSIKLTLDGVLPATSICEDYGVIVPSGTATNFEVISAAIDFDLRDLFSCDDFVTYFNYTPINSGTTFATNATYVNTNYLIDKSLVLASGDELEFQNCNLLFKQNASHEISIPSNAKVELTGTGTNILSGCQFMWKGITVESSGEFHALGTDGDRIEDATQALLVEGNGATSDDTKVSLIRTRFNNNKVSLRFENDNFSRTDVIIQGCWIDCSSGYLLKAPMVNDVVSTHVYLDEVSDITFRHISSTRTKFRNAAVGITAINSGFTMEFCDFDSLRDFSASPPLLGTGILAINTATTQRNLKIGLPSGSSYNGTSFRLLKYGAICRGNINLEIENCRFQNIETNAINGILNNPTCSLNIYDNYFVNTNIGCNITGFGSAYINIAENKMENTAFSWITQGSFYNTAINVVNPFHLTASNVFVNQNTIKDFRIGIHAANIQGIKIGTDDTFVPSLANKIEFNLGENPATSVYHAGIWLQNCDDAFIKGESNEDIINDTEVKGTGMDYFRGIDIVNSNNCRINCNHILNIPRSIYFTGDCNLSKMRLNKFENFENGVELFDDQTILPPQGEDPGTGFLPYDNEWIDGTMVEFRTFRNNSSNPPLIDWYYDNAINGALHDPEPSNTVSAQPRTVDCDCDCNTNTRLTDRDRSIGNIVNDSLYFSEHPEEFSYQAKMNVFLAMKSDSTLIYQGASNDSIYLNFYNSMLNSNMNRLDSVIILSDQALTEAAHDLNEAISDTNYVEYYLKIVGDIYLNGPAINMPLSYSDSTTLEEIAYLPYTLAGKSIYAAAAMLGIEVHPQAGGSSRTGSNSVSNANESIQDPILMVYPNPSNEKVYFEFKQMDTYKTIYFKIYDSLGREVWQSTISDPIYEVDVNSFTNGLYRFTANDFDKVMFTGNFVVTQ